VAWIRIARSGGRLRGAAHCFIGILLGIAISAVAIPGLLRSRIGSGESSHIASLKAISTGMEQFRNAHGEYASLEVLAGVKAHKDGVRFEGNPYIPRVLGDVDANGVSLKSGHCFKLYLRGKDSFVVYAWPQKVNRTGTRLFAVMEAGQPFTRGPSPFDGPSQIPPVEEIDRGEWTPVG
ncbi:MAG: hypothetical protein MUC63_10790, partial [Planctomycetes bacterium]|nr:hypothetical protein [Planctomycetota bacterium]